MKTIGITEVADLAANCSEQRQKWSNIADFNRRRRWRGPALGGRLQRGAQPAALDPVHSTP